VRIGILLLSAQFPGQSHAQVLERTVASAVAAEAAGFDDVWVAEHHFMSYGVCPSALTLAGYLLAATTRVTVGTAVCVLPTQHPVAVAEQALLLDQLSGGRLVLGVGRGGPWIDLRVFGDDGAADPRAGFPEALDHVLAAVSGRPVRGSGPGYRFPEVQVVPGPRAGKPPAVLVAATSTESVEMAARRRLPVLLGMHADDGEKARMVADHRRLAGTAVGGHVSAHLAYVADTDRDAEAAMRGRLPLWLGPGLAGYRRADGAAHPTRDPDEYAALLCRLHPVGSPETCRRRLLCTAATTGVEHAILVVEGHGDPARTLENIRRLGAEVLPALRAPTPAAGRGGRPETAGA
jgi:alkanesulfonate monooxygenase SsuD/methylene tetrahydromethanopterin reductase-like flavin-dependent oxidoreductase (luciferase family)